MSVHREGGLPRSDLVEPDRTPLHRSLPIDLDELLGHRRVKRVVPLSPFPTLAIAHILQMLLQLEHAHHHTFGTQDEEDQVTHEHIGVGRGRRFDRGGRRSSDAARRYRDVGRRRSANIGHL